MTIWALNCFAASSVGVNGRLDKPNSIETRHARQASTGQTWFARGVEVGETKHTILPALASLFSPSYFKRCTCCTRPL
jgi:hypothetical protein